MSEPVGRSALLVMDVQPGIVERVHDSNGYLARVSAALSAARGSGMPVIHVVVGFRPGMPEISARNQSFGPLKLQAATMLIDPRPVLPPAAGEVVVTKRRVSAFTGSDLEVVLRGGGIQHLVLCGIATSGVVLSTVREAADQDYGLTVLADLCADFDPEVHAVLLGKVFPRQARVITGGEWASTLAAVAQPL